MAGYESGSTVYGSGGGGPPLITIDVSSGREQQASNRGLVGIMDEMNLGAGEQQPYGAGDDDDDLLGLMDSAE